jgi:hypothetical protein
MTATPSHRLKFKLTKRGANIPKFSLSYRQGELLSMKCLASYFIKEARAFNRNRARFRSAGETDAGTLPLESQSHRHNIFCLNPISYGATIMSPQETQVLQDFLNQLTQVRGVVKDPEADAMISKAVSQQPDAAYLLVQRAVLLDQALIAAKAHITNLQGQLQAAQQPVPAFLDPANAWGNSSSSRPTNPMPSAPAPSSVAVPTATVRPGFFGGGFGNILGNVAMTAAGVAGGEFLFQGLEHMFSHHPGHGLLDQQSGISPLAAPIDTSNFGDISDVGNLDDFSSNSYTDDDSLI